MKTNPISAVLVVFIIIVSAGLIIFCNSPKGKDLPSIKRTVYFYDKGESKYLYAIDTLDNIICSDKDLAIKVLHDELMKQFDSTRKYQQYLEIIINNEDITLTPRELLNRIVID